MSVADVDQRLAAAKCLIEAIRAADAVDFRDLIPSRLPTSPGIYVISLHDGQVLRVGQTVRQTLRSRIYRNHLMGSQNGNLPAQLIRDGVCPDFTSARLWIRSNCQVQWLDARSLQTLGLSISAAEYFLLALLQPKYCE